VGRLTVQKGIPVLLEAWRRAAPGQLTILGDGPERAAVEAAAASQPTVRYVGEADRSEVLEAMQRAEVLVVPSVWQEPFGLVVTEAFASETPVIAGRKGALSELVTEAETGFLYEALDPDDLVATVRTALADPGRLRVMGAQAREVFEARYSADANYELLLGAYQDALAYRSSS
jgi:glycosyltransferase involved in cell wall biosynthesis